MIGPKLQLRQSQALVMTPQLRQAINLLQMSNLELEGFLDEAIERNPLLTRDAEGPAAAPEAEASAPEGERAERLDAAFAADDPGAAAARLDLEAGALWPDAPEGAGPAGFAEAGEAPLRPSGPGAGTLGGGPPDGAGLPESQIAAAPSLLEHLATQIGRMRAPDAHRAAALALAGEVDADGRLTVSPSEAALRLGVPPAVMEAGAALLRACEPTGIGAANLAECLALQLAEQGRLDPAMQALLADLPLLAEGRIDLLALRCGVAREEIPEMAAELRRLDPRPGLALAPPEADAAPPDVLVSAAPDGGWRVELNEATLPRLLIDRAYAAELSAAGGPARAFAQECSASAAFLLRSLDQRARTMLAVAGEIVRRQDGFLREGVAALRPMTLRQVADEIGVHESTVSRVAAGKRMACPRGSFEMRVFFSQALAASDGGEARSAAAVRARIRALIEAEAPGAPLSDDALAHELKTEGVDVARRTVAKYREAMSIPSSSRRRRLKAAGSG